MTPELKVPFQSNDGGVVALLPDGRVEFLHPSVAPLLRDINVGAIAAEAIDFDEYILTDPFVNLDRFHLAAPAIAFIEVTNLCNLSCKHCYAHSGPKRDNEMSSERIAGLLEEFDALGVLQVFLTGGEVFAHPAAVDLITVARSKRFSTQIFTNGLLITPEKLRRIPAGTSFFISFDTADPVRTIRGKMDFPKLRDCFEAMRDHGHIFRTAISVHRFNVDDAEDIFDWCGRHGYPRPQWLETHPIGRALLHPDILLTPDHVDHVFEVYKRCMERYTPDQREAEAVAGFQDRGAATTRAIDTIKFCQRLEQATGREKCGRSIAYVNSAGEVYPCSNCMSTEMFAAGNINQSDFRQIWESGFDAIRRITFADHEAVCGSCPVHNNNFWCQFRCPPLAQNVSGDATACGATDYLKAFMVKAGHYWEERKRRGIQLSMQPNLRVLAHPSKQSPLAQ